MSAERDVRLEILAGNLSEAEHTHEDLELIYVVDGVCEVLLDQRLYTMEREQVILVNTNRSHAVRIYDPDALVCRLTLSYFAICSRLKEDYLVFECNSAVRYRESFRDICRILQDILLDYANYGDAQTYERQGLYYLLISQLTRRFRVAGIAAGTPAEWEDDRRLSVITNYVHMNYDRPVSLEEVSEKLYVSASSLSRFFRKAMGESFVSYVRRFRLQRVAEELMQTEAQVTRIAVECGFSNPSAMNRDFREFFGMTPGEYREKYRAGDTSEELQRERAGRERVRELLCGDEKRADDAESRQEQIRVDVRQYRNYRKYENTILNAGTAFDMQTADMQRQICLAQNWLHAEYIRIWSWFSERLMIMEDNGSRLNFGKLDNVLDFCVENHFKVFLEMSSRTHGFMVSESKMSRKFEEGIVFRSQQQWENVFERFVIHVLKRYGRRTVSTWVFEFTFFLNEHPYYISDNYSTRTVWESGYRIVKSHIPEARVAGPGMPAMFDREMLENMMGRFLSTDCQPDIFTFFCFPYAEATGLAASKTMAKTDFLETQILLIRKILRDKGFAGACYLTDWNVSLATRNYIQDSCYRGTYILNHALYSYELVDGMGVFMVSDLSNFSYDSDTVLIGGTGILSRDGICKPAFFAFSFLTELGEYLIQKGENYIVTRDREGYIRVLCFNTKNLGANYFLAEEDAYEPGELSKLFQSHESLKLTVLLEHLRDGAEYLVRQKLVSEEEGSALDHWVKLGCERELLPEDIRYLQNVSVPSVRIERVRASGGEIRMEISLSPHEMRLISVEEA